MLNRARETAAQHETFKMLLGRTAKDGRRSDVTYIRPGRPNGVYVQVVRRARGKGWCVNRGRGPDGDSRPRSNDGVLKLISSSLFAVEVF